MGMKFDVSSGLPQGNEIEGSSRAVRRPVRMDGRVVRPGQVEKGISEVVGADAVAVVTVGAAVDPATTAGGNSVIGQ